MSSHRHPVLIVEDDADIRCALREILEDEGYVVEAVDNGLLALERLQAAQRAPCIVLLDLMMPGISGIEVLKHLHDQDKLVTIPVVVMTASNHIPPQGDVRWMKKPIDLNALIQEVHGCCG